MTVATAAAPSTTPKAFGVWFKDLKRWDVSSFYRIAWHWPQEAMIPLGDLLTLQKEKVDRKKFEFADLQPITIHFDGSIDKRKIKGNREYTMGLFFARPGDVIVAKIDLKNGAVAIVPDDWQDVVVTSHFAVYQLDRSRVEPGYFHRVIQAPFFKRHLWRNKVGAEGRKEVKLDFFAAQRIPIPPLLMQQAIVSAWELAQREVAKARRRIQSLQDKIESDFLAELGLAKPAAADLPKCFAVQWIDFRRWSVSYNQRSRAEADLTKGTYPVVALGTCLEALQYGTSEKANRDGRGTPILRIKNIKGGKVETGDLKHIELSDSARAAILLNDGDILIIRTSGSRELVGTCAVFHDDGQYVFASYLIRLRPELGRALADYLAYFINCSLGQAQVDAVSRQIMQNNINTEEIRALEIPLPPLPIQRRMVKKIIAGGEKIAGFKAEADRIASQAKADVEAMILGKKRVKGG